jgi:geranylgeranyl reductase family protein
VERWDVIIVGAGPAGCAAALSARHADPTARVLLLDSATFPRDKACGDGVAPHVLDVLAGLGVEPAALVAGSTPITRMRWDSPGGIVADRPLPRPCWVVPRETFDARLVDSAVAAGAVLRQRRVRTVRQIADEVVVDGELTARAVVAADGAESTVRRAVGAGRWRAGTVGVALRGYAAAVGAAAQQQVLRMTTERWPAYAWLFPIGDGRMNVGYGEVLRRGEAPWPRRYLTDALRRLVPELDGSPVDRLRGHRLPLSTGRSRLTYGRVLLAGDAAALINPLTGEGIYYAVVSGSLAGAAALQAEPAPAYTDAVRRALGRHFLHTDLLARAVRWPAFIDASIRAGRDAQRSFDVITEIGLGSGLVDPVTLAHVVAGIPAAALRRA